MLLDISINLPRLCIRMVHASPIGAPRARADRAIVAVRHKALEAITMNWWSWLGCAPYGCSHSRGHRDSISRPK